MFWFFFVLQHTTVKTICSYWERNFDYSLYTKGFFFWANAEIFVHTPFPSSAMVKIQIWNRSTTKLEFSWVVHKRNVPIKIVTSSWCSRRKHQTVFKRTGRAEVETEYLKTKGSVNSYGLCTTLNRHVLVTED